FERRELSDPQIGAPIGDEGQVLEWRIRLRRALGRRRRGVPLEVPAGEPPAPRVSQQRRTGRREWVSTQRPLLEPQRLLGMLSVELPSVVPGGRRVDLPVVEGEPVAVPDLLPRRTDPQREDQRSALDRNRVVFTVPELYPRRKPERALGRTAP